MKLTRFRLQRSHWFSGVLLLLLAAGLFRPGGTGTGTVGTVGTGTRPLAQQGYQKVTLYRVVSNSDDQWLEATPGTLPAQEDPMAGALSLMAKLPPSESPLPAGTRVLSVTLRKDGVAWVDFNKALVANFPGGSLRESLTINSVLGTLAQFPAVRAVQFTVEGKIIESIGGHEDVSEPQAIPRRNENHPQGIAPT